MDDPTIAQLTDCIEYLDEMIAYLNKADGNLKELEDILYPLPTE